MEFAPLSEKMRPARLADFAGQDHLTGKDGLVRKILEGDVLFSLILWGPPGSGKTTLARIIAKAKTCDFVEFSAVSTKLEEIRGVVAKAKESQKLYGKRTILFLDEIHRFSKSQQGIFLPHVEDGSIILFASTTENPSFEVIAPLLSRSRVLVLNKLDDKALRVIARRALKLLGNKMTVSTLKKLLSFANGDARILINTLEIASQVAGANKGITINDEMLIQASGRKNLEYDRNAEEHYNTISAFIKSMRASDADASVYYLARMVEGGEDPLFIARRMVIFASEDIGMAQPTALVVANEVFRACETIGYPECAINLAHGAIFLAKAKKDRSAYDALRKAQSDVRDHGNLPIPMELRNAPTTLMKSLGYGKGYEKYPQKDKSLLPDKLKKRKYYR